MILNTQQIYKGVFWKKHHLHPMAYSKPNLKCLGYIKTKLPGKTFRDKNDLFDIIKNLSCLWIEESKQKKRYVQLTKVKFHKKNEYIEKKFNNLVLECLFKKENVPFFWAMVYISKNFNLR